MATSHKHFSMEEMYDFLMIVFLSFLLFLTLELVYFLFSIFSRAHHNSAKDCWIVIHGKVYDVTSFLSEHPGGAKIILNYAGKDATPGFEPIHSPGNYSFHRAQQLPH